MVPGGDDDGVDVLAVEQVAVVGVLRHRAAGDLAAPAARRSSQASHTATHSMPPALLATLIR